MNKKIKLNTQKNIFKIIFSIKIAVVLTFFVIYEMLLVTHINEKGYGRWILEAALMLTITVALSCIIHFKQKIECESFDNINKLYTKFFITMLMILIFSSFGILGFLIRDKVFAAKDCVILYWGFIQLLISFLIIRFIQFKSNIDRLKNLGFNIPIEKSLKEEKKSRDKTVRMIWIITIFCYLMLVLKVGFNYWIYSIGLTILVIDIFLLVMSRVEDNDDKDGKCVKQLDTPKVLEMSDESLPTLKCQFRLAKENSKAISIDPATGTIASNSTEEKISVSSDGKVTIKSTEKETYIVECVISADHYKTLAKPVYIYVR